MTDSKNLEHKLLKTIQALNNINASIDYISAAKVITKESASIDSSSLINIKLMEENILLKNRISELQKTIAAVNKEVKDIINEINLLTKV